MFISLMNIGIQEQASEWMNTEALAEQQNQSQCQLSLHTKTDSHTTHLWIDTQDLGDVWYK